MKSREQIVTSTANAALQIVKDLRKDLKKDITLIVDSRIQPLEEVLETLIKELNPPSKQFLVDKIKKKKK